jgi:hypothetical protein
VITRKAIGCSGSNDPGGSTGRWIPFCPPSARNVGRSVKFSNSVRYPAVLAPIGSGARSGDDDADLARRDLHPRVLGHRVDRPQLEPDAGHQQPGLVAGLALEGQWLVGGQPAADPLVHQPDLGRSDESEGLQDDEERDQDRDEGGGREQGEG